MSGARPPSSASTGAFPHPLCGHVAASLRALSLSHPVHPPCDASSTMSTLSSGLNSSCAAIELPVLPMQNNADVWRAHTLAHTVHRCPHLIVPKCGMRTLVEILSRQCAGQASVNSILISGLRALSFHHVYPLRGLSRELCGLYGGLYGLSSLHLRVSRSADAVRTSRVERPIFRGNGDRLGAARLRQAAAREDSL